jgi:dTDP-6-deoxy-L-talose 4-dehydrogenase (NAD+)
MKRETVLLTGGTGFIGRHVLSRLLANGVHIKLITRTPIQYLDQVSKKVEVVFTPNAFVESIEWWKKQCTDIDRVIHLAWYVEPGKYLDSFKNLECLNGSINLALASIHSGITKFVGIGTCFEYDLEGILPKKTDSPLNPKSIYAVTKVSLFLILLNLFNSSSIDFAWGRLFYLYGEGEDSRRLTPYLHNQLSSGLIAELTSGSQIRDFLDVKEAAKIIVETAFNSANGPINICSGNGVSIRKFAEEIADLYGRRDLLRFVSRHENSTDPHYIVGSSENF